MVADVPLRSGAVPQRSILLVGHVTPPSTMSAARRAAGLTKYLTRQGHRITVLTSVFGGTGPVPEAFRTIRTPDLLVSRINWRRSNLSVIKGEAEADYAERPSSLGAWLVPDLEVVGWVPFAIAATRRLLRTDHFDCVITTSPPRSAHLIGALAQRRGVPWLADFRDGWNFESHRLPWGHSWLGSFDHALERALVRRADAITAVTEPIAADLRGRFGRPVETVTNGFDPDAPEASPAGIDGMLSRDRRSLVHTGNLAYGGRPLTPLLDALRELQASASQADRLEAVLVGPVTASERDAVRRAALGDAVRLTGPVSHETALALQREADGLLVITGPQQTGVATGKLFEYLTAGRPIMVIGDDTAAAEIVRRLDAGIAVPADDPKAIAEGLRRFLAAPGDLPRPRRDTLTPFGYPALAAQMAEQVERAVASSRRGRAPSLV